MYELQDTFNDHTISRHRTLDAAVRAARKHDTAVKRANGQSSYIPYSYRLNGQPVDQDELMAAKQRVDQAR